MTASTKVQREKRKCKKLYNYMYYYYIICRSCTARGRWQWQYTERHRNAVTCDPQSIPEYCMTSFLVLTPQFRRYIVDMIKKCWQHRRNHVWKSGGTKNHAFPLPHPPLVHYPFIRSLPPLPSSNPRSLSSPSTLLPIPAFLSPSHALTSHSLLTSTSLLIVSPPKCTAHSVWFYPT